jgi:acyl-coenzyme A synthetase/AMP-(fatty) acid ligase
MSIPKRLRRSFIPIYTHPKVTMAVVIGLPDPRSGETVKVFVPEAV